MSDVSVRGLFEEIKQLKKENLDLKLKIYFLEDSNSQSNRIKELIDHNVKLKIEVEESKNEVDRKKLLIEETISILDEQQSKLDEYERKFKVLGRKSDYFKSRVLIYFLERTCEELRTELSETQEQELESRGSTPTPFQLDRQLPQPIVDQENFNFTRFEDKMQPSAFSCDIL